MFHKYVSIAWLKAVYSRWQVRFLKGDPVSHILLPSCVHHISNMEHFRNFTRGPLLHTSHRLALETWLKVSVLPPQRAQGWARNGWTNSRRGCGRCCDEGRHRMVVETSATRERWPPCWPECLRINLFAKPLLLFLLQLLLFSLWLWQGC